MSKLEEKKSNKLNIFFIDIFLKYSITSKSDPDKSRPAMQHTECDNIFLQ